MFLPRLRRSLRLVLGTLFAATAAARGDQTSESAKLLLHRNWQLQSSCQVVATGAQVSTAGFRAAHWHSAQVPTTVVAALVADKTYPDPYFGMNLKSFPGTDYPKTGLFANQAMPEGSPFRCSWWFRTEFRIPAAFAGRSIWLHFDALNYRANIWLNGQKIADAQDVAGTYRVFEFAVTRYLVAGKRNALAVEVFAPDKTDLGMTWVDWNPTPPDKDMGLWKDVYLTSSGDVSLRSAFVATKLQAADQSASVTIVADLHNGTDHPRTVTLLVQIEAARLSQKVELGPAESRTVSFDSDQYPQLKLAHPRLWWPYQMGRPEIYAAKLAVEAEGHLSDAAEVHFGVREITSELTERGYRLFRVNGRRVLIRGAAWAPDMLLRWSPKRAQAGLEYTRAMGLNAIRLEGRMERDEFFDMADRLGILVMPGWTCCDMWEHWKDWTAETTKIAAASLSDQARRLRNHPSVLVWLYGSDNPPPPNVEEMYLGILAELKWPNPSLSSASQQGTSVSGPSGVKMTGPYDYVPPNYWLADREAGGAYGFNTETGPGPAIPPLESLRRFLPPDHLWPIDEYWNYHAGGQRFTTLDKFLNGLNRRYGKAGSLEDFLRKSQAMNYEGQRAMFEAYARNKYTSTGVIQWMLNNAWPSLIWHLYDYYMVPAGGYFGVKKACEPVHVQYSYDDGSVIVINGGDRALSALKVKAGIYGLDGKEQALAEETFDVAADSSILAIALPAVNGMTATYFLKLTLQDARGMLLSDNFYWLSTRPDVLDWSKRQDTVYTPQSAYADFSELSKLPPVKLKIRSQTSQPGREQVIEVLVENPSPHLAFMVHLRLAKSRAGDDLAPVFWDDNYFSLLPGEKREVRARFDRSLLEGKPPAVVVDGWNVAASGGNRAPH